MKDIVRPVDKFPWWAIPLVGLASFSFEYNTPTSRLTYNGFGIAIGVLAIIMLFMSFRLLNGIQKVLLARKQMVQSVSSRFAVLLPFVIIVPGIGYRALSDRMIEGAAEKKVYAWDFQWGASPLHVWLIGIFIAFLFLHTLLLIIREVLHTAERSAEPIGSANAG